MSLYGGIDLHANNRVVVLLNEQESGQRDRIPDKRQSQRDVSDGLRDGVW
jgi:hypothetical protein